MSGCRPLKTPTAQIPSGEAAVDITLSRGYGTYDTYRDVHVRSGFCVVGAMMSEKNQQMLQNEVCGYFADCPEVALAYLFGSRAEGNAAPSSDYDFGVLLVPDAAPDCRYRIQHELLEVLNATEVDVVVLGEAPVTLAYNVIASGQLVYEKDRATRVDFEANLMSKYCDYLPILRRQREDILKETRG
ncbi:MAG: type VII toxin-antitoxin system MntA family adenylyltransferase antitoxin [Candidatus Brocadiia bacterium]